MNKLIYILISLSLFSCNQKTDLQGKWLFELNLQNKSLPFVMEFKGSDATLYNGKQTLNYKNVQFKDGVFKLSFDPYNIGLEGTLKDGKLTGHYIKYDRIDYKISFSAVPTDSKERFNLKAKSPAESLNGKWKLDFKEKKGVNSTMGLFEQKNNHLHATIRTTTGDYGFIEGEIRKDHFLLYSFDGPHAFIFEGEVSDKRIVNGKFFAGKSWNQSFTGLQDIYFELPDPNKQTYLKDKNKALEFYLKDLKGNILSSKSLKGKVKVLQIFGSWCPNCLDETRFFAKWYKENQKRGVEIVAISFERAASEAQAIKNIKKVVDRAGATYPFLLAAHDKSKFGPNKLFPNLVNFISYPTTIIIDKKDRVRKIHAGFNGPATGKYYDRFVDEFNLFINKLLAE